MVLKCSVELSKSSYERLLNVIKELDEGGPLAKQITSSMICEETSPNNVLVSSECLLALQKQKSFCLHHFVEPSSFKLFDFEKPKVQNHELAARLEKFRKQAEQKSYDDLVSNIVPPSESISNFATEVRSLDRQIISVVNFVITVAGAFTFGYKAPELLLGVDDPLMGLLLGLVLGTIVFIADIYFLIVRGV